MLKRSRNNGDNNENINKKRQKSEIQDLARNKKNLKLIGFALFFDMVHDFLETGGILSDHEQDMRLLEHMYSLAFPESTKMISDFLTPNVRKMTTLRMLEHAHDFIYTNTTAKFVGINVNGEPIKVTQFSKISNVAIPLTNSKMLYNKYLSQNQRKENAINKQVYIVENAQKSARAIPALYSLIVSTQYGKSNSRVIPINSMPRRYNQAAQKFPTRLNVLKSHKYKVGKVHVTLAHLSQFKTAEILRTKLEELLMPENDIPAINVHDYFTKRSGFKMLRTFFAKSKNYTSANIKNLHDPFVRSDDTLLKKLNTLFPDAGSKRYEKFLKFKSALEQENTNGKTKKVVSLDYALSKYARNSIAILKRYNVWTGSAKTLIKDILAYEKYEPKAKAVICVKNDKDTCEGQHVEYTPSVKNVVKTARAFMINQSSIAAGKKKQFLNSIDKKTNTTERSPKLDKSVSAFLSTLVEKRKKEKNDTFFIQLFSILFSKTAGDLSQIAFALQYDNMSNTFEQPNKTKLKQLRYTYFLTFDKLAALIALICGCKVIYTGDASVIGTSEATSGAQAYNKKVGYSVIGPIGQIAKGGRM